MTQDNNDMRPNDWRTKALTGVCVGVAVLSAGCAAAVVANVAMSEVAHQNQAAVVNAVKSGTRQVIQQANRRAESAAQASAASKQNNPASAVNQGGLASAGPALNNRPTSPLMPRELVESQAPPTPSAVLPPAASSAAPSPPPVGDLNEWADTPASGRPSAPSRVAAASVTPAPIPAAPVPAASTPATVQPVPPPPAVAAAVDAPRYGRVMTADAPATQPAPVARAPRRIVLADEGIQSIPEFADTFEVVAGH